jgi:hypothetical protein
VDKKTTYINKIELINKGTGDICPFFLFNLT